MSDETQHLHVVPVGGVKIPIELLQNSLMPLGLEGQSSLFQASIDGHEQRVARERLGYKVVGPSSNGLHCQFHSRVARNDHANYVGVLVQDRGQQLNAASVGKHHVQQDQIEVAFPDLGQPV